MCQTGDAVPQCERLRSLLSVSTMESLDLVVGRLLEALVREVIKRVLVTSNCFCLQMFESVEPHFG